MIGILGGMGTQAGLDFCNKLAKLNRGKLDQQYPMFVLYNKSNTPKRPETLKKNISSSQLEIFKGCGHNVHLEEPQKFNETVKNFLS